MKKFKVFFLSVISVMLCIFCLCNPTFSWFTPSESKKGISFLWDDNSADTDNSFDFNVTNGNSISMVTYSSTDGKTYSETAVNSFSADSSSAIAGGSRKYYKTDITNGDSANAQNVSLYMSSLSIADNATGKFFLGLSSPLKTYKQYGAKNDTSTNNAKVSKGTMRVYFQPKNHTNWTGTSYTVCYSLKSEEPDGNSYVNMTATPTSGTYYADIPSNTKRMYFKVSGSSENYKRTQTFTDVPGDGVAPNQSYVFWHNGSYSSDYNNAQAEKSTVSGANFINCYDSINIGTSGTFSLNLISNTDYIGTITSYSSSSTAIFTVSSNGVITPIKAGSATLSITVKGSDYNDTKTVAIPVNITTDDADESIPIITNLKIPANDTVSVYWYIKNDAEQSTKLYYNIDSLFISL
ncbi:MAG: hypothetical protein U0L20_08815 [Ruminococcus sp.]|nr:hypothetical protein [Ruminococcus sp.]